jgi:hypothetical protein
VCLFNPQLCDKVCYPAFFAIPWYNSVNRSENTLLRHNGLQPAAAMLGWGTVDVSNVPSSTKISGRGWETPKHNNSLQVERHCAAKEAT